MGKIKEAFKHVNYALEATIQWDIISTLADLVNTYKHGDGRSAKRLHKNPPQFFLPLSYSKEERFDLHSYLTYLFINECQENVVNQLKQEHVNQ